MIARVGVWVVLATVLLALGVSGCVTTPRDFEVSDDFVVGHGRTDRSRACAYYLFGIIPLSGDSSAATAFASVTRGHLGKRVSQLTVDEESAFFVVVTRQCTIVTATFVTLGGSGVEEPDGVNVGPVSSTAGDTIEGYLAPGAAELQLRCDLGKLEACVTLAELLRDGRETPKDSTRAAQVFLRACEAGSASACASLGYLFTVGEGVPLNNGRAVELFKRSCAREDARGCSFLGAMLEVGKGITQNRVAAIEAYRRACSGGYAQACERLKAMGAK